MWCVVLCCPFGVGDTNLLGLPPGDYRASSYKKIASSSAARRAALEEERKKQLSSSQVSIDPNAVVHSDISGVGQVAIRGSVADNLVYSQTSPIGQQQSEQSSSAAPISAATQVFQGRASVEDYKAGRVQASRSALVSGSLASYYATLGDRPMSIRGDVPYSVYSSGYQPRKVYNLNSLSEGYGLLSTRTSNRMDYSGNNSDLVGNKSTTESPGFQVAKGLGSFIVSPFIGAGKFLYMPNRIRGSRPLIDIGQGKMFSSKNLILDKDVQNFGIVAGLGVVGKAYPLFSNIAGVGALGYGGWSGLKSYREKNYFSLGESAGMVAFSLPFGAKLVKSAYTATGSKYLPQGEVFAESVLSGKENLPTTSSLPESIRRFQQGRNEEGTIIVQTASPAKINKLVAGVGKKAGAGMEDPGIYVTPYKEGSPYFLGVAAPDGVTSYSLNPFKGIFGVPSVTRFAVQDVVRYPRNVVKVPGFEAVGKYQENVLAGQGVAVITKRSEIGLGSVKSQKFRIPLDKTDNFLGQKRTIYEPGTTEIEAVIPIGQQFAYTPKTRIGKIKGFDYYTSFKGELVAVRDTNLLLNERVIPEGVKVISGRRVASGAKSLSEVSFSRPIYARSISLSKSAISRGESSSKISSYDVSSNLSRTSISRSTIRSSPTSRISYVLPSRLSSLVSRTSGVSNMSRTSAISRVIQSQYYGLSRVSRVGKSYVLSGISRTTSSVRSFNPYFSAPTFKPNMIRLGIRDYRAVRVTKYTPSFGAIYFNIQGNYKKTGLSKSGLDFRPITPGFKLEGYNVQQGVI